MKPDALEAVAEMIIETALKLGADEAVAIAHATDSRMLKLVNNQVEINTVSSETSASVILVKDKKLAVTSIKECSKPCVLDMLKKLLGFTRVLEPSAEYRGIAHGPFTYSPIPGCFDERIPQLGEKSVEIAQSALDAALAQGAKRASGTLTYGLTRTALKTSRAVSVLDEGTDLSLSLRALVAKEESGHALCCARTLDAFNAVSTGERAGRIAKMAVNPKSLPSGRYTVLFDPLPFSNLVNQVMSALPITAVETGMSFLHDKLGKKVASPAFTLWDDGTTPGGFSSSLSDEEGVPSQKNLVIQDGVLKTFLHNTSTAMKYNTKTTGNAGIISPQPNNGVVQPGDMSVDEMIAGMKKGLYVTNLWYTRFNNYMTGDFSTLPRDGIFYIENGKIQHPVTGIRISDNLLRMMMSISAVGKEISQVRGWEVEMPVFVPAVVIDDVAITRSSGADAES